MKTDNEQKSIEEVAEDFWLNDNSMSDADRDAYVNGFVTCANYQKQIDENLAVEFSEWLIDTENKPKGEFTVKQLFDIFQSERTKKA